MTPGTTEWGLTWLLCCLAACKPGPDLHPNFVLKTLIILTKTMLHGVGPESLGVERSIFKEQGEDMSK
jgi:hypothetical protein